MTIDTEVVQETKKNNVTVIKRDQRDVIQQIREITGQDEISINQTIEACKDSTGQYSLDQVISLLLDDTRNPVQQTTNSHKKSQQPTNTSTSVPSTDSSDKSNRDTITDDVIEIDNQQSADDDLERALILSREAIEKMIDESDVEERKSLSQPVGLKNIGNTCWFNSVVQALYTLPYFRQLILNFSSSNLNRPLTDGDQHALDFIDELRHLFFLMLKSPRRSINPDRAIKKFKNARKSFGIDFSHEDCSEFATYLIDLVELAYDIVGKRDTGNSMIPTNSVNPMSMLVTGEVIVERNENNSTHEALRQINIQMNDLTNLYDGLESLWLGSADENLARQQVIVEQRWLTRLPPVLFICLNRYRFSQKTKQASKILTPFEFYPELYLDRYMLHHKNLILNKRNIARKLYAQLHNLENILNSYLKYPCNNESISITNAIRVVYEYATGCRLNPLLNKKSDFVSFDQTTTNRSRQCPSVSIEPSHISNEELYFIQNTLPTWLTEIEAKCASIREEIRNVQNELNQLYKELQLQQIRYTLHAVCVHEGSATLGHFWTYVYHADVQKWYRYNDSEVIESKWSDVFEAGIGGQKAQNDHEQTRLPSAYLLVYVNSEEKLLSNDVNYTVTADLQHALDNDLTLLQQQIEAFKLEELYNKLKVASQCIGRSQKLANLSFFTGSNSHFESEIIKPIMEGTINILKTYSSKLLSVDITHLLQEIVDKHIRQFSPTSNAVVSSLPYNDFRLEHILSYLSVNRVDMFYRQRVMYDIIRLMPLSIDDIKLRIFQLQAQIVCDDLQMSNEEIQDYHKILNDYKDFRSVIAAFLDGCQLLNENKFQEAIKYFCVACEYNVRLSKEGALPMRAMDNNLLFKIRRLCFERWNTFAINRFKSDVDYCFDKMINEFIPCLMQLKQSSEDDQQYIAEVQRIWCLLLDKIEPNERPKSLEGFLECLLEQSVAQHYHSVSINKQLLIERYKDAVRDLMNRYGPFISHNSLQQSSIRSNRISNPGGSIRIPVAISQTRSLSQNQTNLRGSSPMQQGDDDHKMLPPQPSHQPPK